MNISFVRHSLLNRGGDKMIVAYASYLANAGHRVVIKTNHLNTVFELSPQVVVKSFKFPGKIGTIMSLFLETEDADIVVADIIPVTFFLSARNMGRVLYFAQDYNENCYSNSGQKLFVRLLYAICFKLLKVPVIAVSDDLAQTFARRFKTGSKVICNGVDLKKFYYDVDEDLLRLKGDNKAVLFFSRRDYRKGFDLVLATIAKLQASDVVPLEIWTVGEYLTDEEIHCKHRDFGYVGETQLRRIMSSADLFLYPSRNEGFPLMVMEAFACRCPVVTTNAVPYAIDCENALVACIGDVEAIAQKVTQILTDDELAHELADTACRFVLEYSLESSAKEFEAALKAQLEK